MLKTRMMALLLIAILLSGAFGVVAQDQTIVDIAADSENFSTLAELVSIAGLTDTLNGAGPFTVFAPTNDAFALLPAPVMDYLRSDTALLSRVLTYHVAAGEVTSADATTMMAASVEGSALSIVVDEMGVHVENATVTQADIDAANGVIHAIDTVLIPPVELPEVDPLAVVDNIVVAGSSTVYPVTERLGDLFNQDGFAGTITVDSVGTGAGFERFCVNAETDIANASRPIRPAEVDSCRDQNREPLEFYVGIDALAIAVSSENTFVDNLTTEQLAAIFSAAAPTWADVNPAWPAEPIQLFSPGSDSGTYDYFVEVIFDEDEAPIQNSGAQFSEDDNVLVQGILGSPYAIGYFGYAYYQENQSALRAIPVNGIVPNEESAESGEYPLSRPLFIYSDATIMAEKPQVAAFINYYLTYVNSQLGTAEGQIGYFPVSAAAMNRNRLVWLAAQHAGMMGS